MDRHNAERTTPALSPAQAHQLVAPFFDKEWPATDVSDIHTKRIVGGLVNTLHLCWRDTTAFNEPATVLVRHFGLDGDPGDPHEDSISLSLAQQAIVYWEMGRRGWGPKVYGCFSGGRVEEYIHAHTLTAAKATQPDIARDAARSYARLHSLRLPLRRDGHQRVTQDFIAGVRDRRDDVVQTLLALEDPNATEYAALFSEIDWIEELSWVSALFEKHHCKITTTHGDTNHLNILVKNFESDCRVVLIDYETVSYSYRGFDIGGHFNERQYCYDQPHTQLTGYPAPNANEQRLFCEAYLEETRALGEEMSEYDTVDHLMLEAQIGRLYSILFTNLMCMVYDDVEDDPLFLSALIHTVKNYGELKKGFVDMYTG